MLGVDLPVARHPRVVNMAQFQVTMTESAEAMAGFLVAFDMVVKARYRTDKAEVAEHFGPCARERDMRQEREHHGVRGSCVRGMHFGASASTNSSIVTCR